jgi:hypothetical protein
VLYTAGYLEWHERTSAHEPLIEHSPGGSNIGTGGSCGNSKHQGSDDKLEEQRREPCFLRMTGEWLERQSSQRKSTKLGLEEK